MKRDKLIAVYLSVEERDSISKAADREGLELSAWIRQVILKHLRGEPHNQA